MPPLHRPGASGSNSRSPRAGTVAAKQNQSPLYPGLCLQNMLRPGLTPGLGRSPGEGNDNLLQYSCLENPKDRGVWWATVHRISTSQLTLNSEPSLCLCCFLSPGHSCLCANRNYLGGRLKMQISRPYTKSLGQSHLGSNRYFLEHNHSKHHCWFSHKKPREMWRGFQGT